MKRKLRNADSRSLHTSRRDFRINHPTNRSSYQERGMHHLPHGQSYEEPTNVLWLHHLPSARLDEEMLHNKMTCFGEITRIHCVPAEHDAFVEFRTVNEAFLAKEGLQSHFFHDLGIVIKYAAHQFYREVLSYIAAHHGQVTPCGCAVRDASMSHTSTLMRPYASPGVNPYQFKNYGVAENYASHFHKNTIVPNVGSSDQSMPSQFSVYPVNIAMTPAISTAYGTQSATRQLGNGRFLIDRKCFHTSEHNELHNFPATYCFWRGTLEYCGRYVCYASGISVTRRMYYPLPQAVNCCSRAEFNFLRDIYLSGIHYDVFYFIPDSKQDFPGYTSFLQFLKQENCAMVAKIDGGKEIYIVPPSEFSMNVLAVTDPNRLYGVVFTDVEASTSSSMQHPKPTVSAADSNYTNLYQVPPQAIGPNYTPVSIDYQLKLVNSDTPQEKIQPDADLRKAMFVKTSTSEYSYPDDIPPKQDDFGSICSLTTSSICGSSISTTYMASNSTFLPPVATSAGRYTPPEPFCEIKQEYKSTVSAVPSEMMSYQSQQAAHEISEFAPQSPAVPAHFNPVTEPYYAQNMVVPHVPFLSMLQYNVQPGVQQEPTTSAAGIVVGNLPERQPVMPVPANVVNEDSNAAVSCTGETSLITPEFSADRNERYQAALSLAFSLLQKIRDAEAKQESQQNGDQQ